MLFGYRYFGSHAHQNHQVQLFPSISELRVKDYRELCPPQKHYSGIWLTWLRTTYILAVAIEMSLKYSLQSVETSWSSFLEEKIPSSNVLAGPGISSSRHHKFPKDLFITTLQFLKLSYTLINQEMPFSFDRHCKGPLTPSCAEPKRGRGQIYRQPVHISETVADPRYVGVIRFVCFFEVFCKLRWEMMNSPQRALPASDEDVRAMS